MKWSKLLLTVFIIQILFFNSGSAKMYTWTDENNEVHYGDKLPDFVNEKDAKEIKERNEKIGKSSEQGVDNRESGAVGKNDQGQVCGMATSKIKRYRSRLLQLANNKINSKERATIKIAMKAQQTYIKLASLDASSLKGRCLNETKKKDFFVCAASAQDGDSMALCVIMNQYWL